MSVEKWRRSRSRASNSDETRLVDRDLAAASRPATFSASMSTHHTSEPERGEARGRHEADVARADHPDRLSFVRAHEADHPSGRAGASYFWPSRRSDAAMRDHLARAEATA